MAFSSLPSEWNDRQKSPTNCDQALATIEVVNEAGLHLRVAARLAEIVATLSCSIELSSENGRCDATSILSLMGLAAEQGTRLCVTCQGPNAHEALGILLSRLSPEEFKVIDQAA